MLSHRNDSSAPGAGAPRAHQIALSIGVFVISWVGLELAYPPLPLHGDSYEDLLVARDCLAGACQTVGVSTTIEGVEQGALWVSLLAALRGAGWGVAAIHSATLAVSAVAVALWFHVLRMRADVHEAAAGAGMVFAGLAAGRALHVIWNPSLMALPPVLMVGLALRVMDEGRAWLGIPLGLALAFVVESHPVGILVAPGCIVLAALSVPGPFRAFMAGVVATVSASVLYLAMSTLAAVAYWRFIIAHLSAVGTVAAAVSLLAAAVAVGPRFRRLSRRRQDALAVAVLAGPPVAAVAWMVLTRDDSPAGPRYLLPALPAVAMVPALLVARFRHRKPWLLGFAAAGLAVGVASRDRPDPREIRLSALEEVTRHLAREGVTLDHVWARVSGPGCDDLIGGLGALGLALGEGGTRPAKTDLIIRPIPAGEAESFSRGLADDRGAWSILDTASGPVALGEVSSWVDRRHVSYCVGLDGSDMPCRDLDLEAGIPQLVAPADGQVVTSRLTYPHIAWGGVVRGQPIPVGWRMELPVEIPAGAGAREVHIDPPPGRDCAARRFTAAQGLSTDTAFPARVVTLRSTTAPQSGTLTVEVDASACDGEPLRVFPPCLVETTPKDGPELRELLGGGLD